MNTKPLWLLAAIPLLLLGADSGSQKHDITLHLDGIASQFVTANKNPAYQIVSNDHGTFLLEQTSGRTWELVRLTEENTEVGFGWKSIRFLTTDPTILPANADRLFINTWNASHPTNEFDPKKVFPNWNP